MHHTLYSTGVLLHMRYVLDAAAIINSSFADFEGELYIPNSVVSEIRDFTSRQQLTALSVKGRLHFKDPSPETIRDVKRRLGKQRIRKLSSADLDVIALAFELSKTGQVGVLTDDYALQGALSLLNISFEPVAHPGARL